MADGMTPNPMHECPDDRTEQEKLEQIADAMLKAVPFDEGMKLYNERPQFYDAFELLLDHPEYDKAQRQAVVDGLPSDADREELRRLANVINLLRGFYRSTKEAGDDNDPTDA